jgi:hypothetical protein
MNVFQSPENKAGSLLLRENHEFRSRLHMAQGHVLVFPLGASADE